MDKDLYIASCMARIEAIKVQVMGMKADNEFNIHHGENPFYAKDSFNEKAEIINKIADKLRQRAIY